ncbi:MAG: hypothetical protein FJ405_06760, partial [Verrucomicrobia bacterium]|nr:hypothetical protein [Verrucomicrobiota bacterium]
MTNPPPQSRRRAARKLRMLLALGFCLGAVVYWFSTRKSPEQELPANSFHEVKRSDLLITVTEDGSLRAVNETIIRSALEGTARILYLAPEGSYVRRDDLLVELDASAVKDRLHQMEIEYEDASFLLAQARQNLAIQESLAESQIKEAELRVEFAQTDVEKYRDGDAPLQFRTADVRIKVLEEQVRIARERAERTETLFKGNNATRSEMEADALTLKREQLSLDQYKEDLRLVKKFDQPNALRALQATLEKEQLELVRLRHRTSNELSQASADLRTSRRALELLEDNISDQMQRLENAKIYAPQPGLVSYAAVNPFQLAGMLGGDEGRSRGIGRGLSGFRDNSGILRGGIPGGGFGGPGGSMGGGRGRSRGSGSGSGGGGSSASASSSRGSSTPSAAVSAGSAAGGASTPTTTTPSGSSSGAASSTGASLGNSAGGGRSGAGGAGSGGLAGGSAPRSSSSGSPSFTTFPSLRQNSTPPPSASASGALSAAATGTGGGTSMGGQSAFAN